MNMEIGSLRQTGFRMVVAMASACLALAMMLTIAMAGPVNVDGNGLAIQGYDPVAYFTDEMPVKGSPEFAAEYDGATYHFASKEHQMMFEGNPEKYAPQYGGYCAYGLALGSKASIEVDQFTVKDGKLFLNFDNNIQSRWKKDPDGYIKKANANWSKIQ